MKKCLFSCAVVILLLFFFRPFSLNADPVWGKPILLTQPDGSVLRALLYGDEYHHRIETLDGYTILPNPVSGYIEYAVLRHARLSPSGLVVGSLSRQKMKEMDFKKHISDRALIIRELRQNHPDIFHDRQRILKESSPPRVRPLEGTRQIFTVCVDFQSEQDPPTKWSQGSYSPSRFNNRLFSTNPDTLSLANYYKDNSYDQFWPQGTTYPTWVTLPQTASWYKDKGNWRQVIEDALDAIRAENPSYDFSPYTNSGSMDIILVWAGVRETWATFFWPKKGSASIAKYGITVRNYNVVNEKWASGDENTDISTFCHEYGHMTGSPDLYDYSDFQNRPLGKYCIMGWSSATTHFCSWIKWRIYGWVEAVDIIRSGRFKLDALTRTGPKNPRLYKINITHPTEYLLLENRMDGLAPYENDLYRRSGLLLTHVDERYPPADGLPDHTFYGVEAIVPGLDVNYPMLTAYAAHWGRMVWGADYGYTQIGPTYPDDKAPGQYLTIKNGDDEENVIFRNTNGHTKKSGVHITGIGPIGKTMVFSVQKSSKILIIAGSVGGTTDPQPGTYVYDDGEDVSITALEDTFYEFSGWEGQVPPQSISSKSLILPMDINRTIQATFKKIQPPLNLTGEKVLNRSLSQAEYIINLRWQRNSLNSGIGIAGFKILRREGGPWTELRTVPGAVYTYQERGVNKDTVYEYAVAPVTSSGRQGEAAMIVVQ
jgi:M6 family metalloprotease-like protein